MKKALLFLSFLILAGCAMDREWAALRARQQETRNSILAGIEKLRKDQGDCLDRMAKNSMALASNNKQELGCLLSLSAEQVSKYDQWRSPAVPARKALSRINFLQSLDNSQNECFVNIEKEREKLEKDSAFLENRFQDNRRYLRDFQGLLEEQTRSMTGGL